MARLVQPGPDQDHAAERSLLAGQLGHPTVVDSVLEVDDHAVRLGQEANREQGGPVGVVALDRQEDRVEGLLDTLRLIEVQHPHRNHVLAAGPAQP